MIVVNTHQAKSTLSQLISKTLAGEEVIIAKAGKPIVRLVPHLEQSTPRVPGKLKGKIWVASDFDQESEEINVLFYGDEISA